MCTLGLRAVTLARIIHFQRHDVWWNTVHRLSQRLLEGRVVHLLIARPLACHIIISCILHIRVLVYLAILRLKICT